MGEIAGIVLAFGLYVGGTGTSNLQQKGQYMDAAHTAWDGGYVQSGLKPMVDKQMKDLERKYVPKEIEKYGAVSAIVLKVIIQQQLTLTWSF